MTPEPVLILRVDDFPRWDHGLDEFVEFDSVMAGYGLPYILGIIPECEFYPGDRRRMTVGEISYLRRLVRENRVELALHGFTHSANVYKGLKSEIALYDRPELERRIDAAYTWFRDADLPFPNIFIPPFNTFTEANFDLLTEHFRVVMGGSSSLTTFGKFRPQKCGDIVFLPSYGRLHGTSNEIQNALKFLRRETLPSAITLHWAWEIGDRFSDLRSLLREVTSNFQVWTSKRLLEMLE
jgi:hypothetical protein